MPENLVSEQTMPVDNLIADNHPVVEIPSTIVSGTGVLTRGTILGRVTASGKYKAYASGNSDGSEVPRAILARDVDATSADVNTNAYVHGVFNKNALTGYTSAAALKLQEFGIYIKEVK